MYVHMYTRGGEGTGTQTVGDVNVEQECMTVVELQIRTSKISSLPVLILFIV